MNVWHKVWKNGSEKRTEYGCNITRSSYEYDTASKAPTSIAHHHRLLLRVAAGIAAAAAAVAATTTTTTTTPAPFVSLFVGRIYFLHDSNKYLRFPLYS